MSQPTDLKKFNKKEGPSEDASTPLRSRNKIVMGNRGREAVGLQWRGGEKWAVSHM